MSAIPRLLTKIFDNGGLGTKILASALPDCVLTEEEAQAQYAGKTFGIPTGTIVSFCGTSIPEGFKLCNGQAISRTEYAALFAVLGTKYGEGDGSTTFNLPNLDKRFIEYVTSLEEVGNYVEPGLPDITGKIPGMRRMDDYTDSIGALFWSSSWDGSAAFDLTIKRPSDPNIDAARCSSIYGASSTVQPTSVRLMPCVRT